VETIDGVNIIGLPHHSSQKDFEFANLLSSLSDRNVPQFLLYHEPRPKDCKKSQKEKIDLQLSGHTHNGQIFPLHLITHILFGGYSHGLLKKQNFYQYTTSGIGCWGPPFRTTNSSEIVNFITK
jgi:predicted MPP superfamily phosphohydrolase